MTLILSLLKVLFKIAFLAGVVVVLVAASLWGIHRAGLVTFRAREVTEPAPKVATQPLDGQQEERASAPSARTLGTESATESGEANRESLDALTAQGEALKAEADREYRELREQLSKITSPRRYRPPRTEPQVSVADEGDAVFGPAEPEPIAPAADAPDYSDLRRQLAQIPNARPKTRPFAKKRTPVVPETAMDAPGYDDLKRRLASALE